VLGSVWPLSSREMVDWLDRLKVGGEGPAAGVEFIDENGGEPGYGFESQQEKILGIIDGG
jgi:hypothetical protein